jgi:hypothetical protein
MIPQGLGGAGGAMRKNLVIVAAGDRSLHRAWLAADRSFDLWVIYYGDNPETLETYRAAADRCFSAKGLKIALARSLLVARYFGKAFDLVSYAHIWFPDDDLSFPAGSSVDV